MPRDEDSLMEIERALSVLASRDVRRRLYERLARENGIDLPALEAWTLARIHEGAPGPAASLATRIDVEPQRLSAAAEIRIEAEGTDLRLGSFRVVIGSLTKENSICHIRACRQYTATALSPPGRPRRDRAPPRHARAFFHPKGALS